MRRCGHRCHSCWHRSGYWYRFHCSRCPSRRRPSHLLSADSSRSRWSDHRCRHCDTGRWPHRRRGCFRCRLHSDRCRSGSTGCSPCTWCHLWWNPARWCSCRTHTRLSCKDRYWRDTRSHSFHSSWWWSDWCTSPGDCWDSRPIRCHSRRPVLHHWCDTRCRWHSRRCRHRCTPMHSR
jgi:hypothetical protein